MFRIIFGAVIAIAALNYLKKGKQIVTTKVKQTQDEWDNFWR